MRKTKASLLHIIHLPTFHTFPTFSTFISTVFPKNTPCCELPKVLVWCSHELCLVLQISMYPPRQVPLTKFKSMSWSHYIVVSLFNLYIRSVVPSCLVSFSGCTNFCFVWEKHVQKQLANVKYQHVEQTRLNILCVPCGIPQYEDVHKTVSAFDCKESGRYSD